MASARCCCSPSSRCSRYTNAEPVGRTVLIGIAFSLVPAVLWPAVPYLVAAERLGTAYGLMTMMQNIGLTVLNLGAGALNDASGAGPDNPAGYRPMLWMFLAAEPGRVRVRGGAAEAGDGTGEPRPRIDQGCCRLSLNMPLPVKSTVNLTTRPG